MQPRDAPDQVVEKVASVTLSPSPVILTRSEDAMSLGLTALHENVPPPSPRPRPKQGRQDAGATGYFHGSEAEESLYFKSSQCGDSSLSLS